MLMDLPELVDRYNLKMDGVLHLGCHLAEEAKVYDDLKVGDVTWVEANPDLMPTIHKKLRGYSNQRALQALVYSEDEVELDFNVTNYQSMSSSIYEFGTHTQFSPDTVFVETKRLKTRTVDSLVEEYGFSASFLNMDLQGAEGPALRGAWRFLQTATVVMSEVNKADVYVGCTRVEELDRILSEFRRVETYWVPGQNWGDALWIRRD